MSNIKFSYLYRDSANYKNYGYVVFDNQGNINIESLKAFVRSMLIDDTWFYPKVWGLPDLYFNSIYLEADPTWHEFEDIECTEATGTHCLSTFTQTLEKLKA